jgi:hypothetical protein
MGRGVKNNRRRSSTRKVKQVGRFSHHKKYVRPDIDNEEVRSNWDSTKTMNQNLKALGMARNINDVGGRAHRAKAADKDAATVAADKVEWVPIPESTVPRRGHLFMSEEEQRYLRQLIERYGANYAKMAMDTKRNWKQHTKDHLQTRCERYLARIKAAEDIAADEGAAAKEGGSDGKKGQEAEEEEEEEEDDEEEEEEEEEA